MAEIVIMPKLGFNMDQGKIINWFKSEGDEISKGEPLFSIETDKTVIEIEATSGGCVRKILAEEGAVLDVTLPIAVIADRDEDIKAMLTEAEKQLQGRGNTGSPDSSNEAASETAPEIPEPASSVQAPAGLKVTPRARKFAADNGIDPSNPEINATGYRGGICEKDLKKYLETAGRFRATPLARKMAGKKGADLSEISGSGPLGKITSRDLAGLMTSPSSAAAAGTSTDGKEMLEKVPYSGIRKVIGDRLSESKFTAPHLYFTQKVNMEKLIEIRKEINGELEIKTSLTDFIARAVTMSLTRYPDINASLVNGMIEKYKTVNLGIAVAAPSGLIVPNIKNAENMNVIQLNRAAADLIAKARDGKLSPAEYSGGTFTISNLGMFGIENFTAIINPPESAILAVSSTKDEPWVVEKAGGEKVLEIKPVMNINLTVDHRLIDGLAAAQFITGIKELLEHPVRLVI